LCTGIKLQYWDETGVLGKNWSIGIKVEYWDKTGVLG
jgi:hypothetical protein